MKMTPWFSLLHNCVVHPICGLIWALADLTSSTKLDAAAERLHAWEPRPDRHVAEVQLADPEFEKKLVTIKVGEQNDGWTFVLDHTCRDQYPKAPKQMFVGRAEGLEEFTQMAPHRLSALVGFLTGCETAAVDLTQVVFLDPKGLPAN
jgi:hypothetical protein